MGDTKKAAKEGKAARDFELERKKKLAKQVEAMDAKDNMIALRGRLVYAKTVLAAFRLLEGQESEQMQQLADELFAIGEKEFGIKFVSLEHLQAWEKVARLDYKRNWLIVVDFFGENMVSIIKEGEGELREALYDVESDNDISKKIKSVQKELSVALTELSQFNAAAEEEEEVGPLAEEAAPLVEEGDAEASPEG